MNRRSPWMGQLVTALIASLPLRPDPIPAPPITVASLFDEVVIGLDDHLQAGRWELVGDHALSEWPRGAPAAKAAGLREVVLDHRFIPIPPLTSRPVRLGGDELSRAYFRGVPETPAFVPRDGSWIGFKYVFYPTAVVNPSRLPGPASEPLTFFLVKPAPEHVSEADLAPALAPAAEALLLEGQLQAYACYHEAKAKLRQGHVSEALANLICSAGQGFCQAQFELGLHELKRGTRESAAIGQHYLRLAADQHMPEAAAALAKLEADGLGQAP